jgi:hypothetical protein
VPGYPVARIVPTSPTAVLLTQTTSNTALNHRNGPSVTPIHDTAINSPVLVWIEGQTGRSGSWTGPFKLLGIDKETCHIELPILFDYASIIRLLLLI